MKNRVLRGLTREQQSVMDGIHAGSIVIDVGANVGEFSELFSMRGASVVALEPNPVAYAVLTQKAIPRVLALRYGAGTEKAVKKLFHHELAERDELGYSKSASLLENKPNVSSNNFSYIRTMDLASFVMEFPSKIYLMKMDIEGYEVEVIPHLVATGALDNIEYCFVETHEDKFSELQPATEAMIAAVEASNTSCKMFFDWH